MPENDLDKWIFSLQLSVLITLNSSDTEASVFYLQEQIYEVSTSRNKFTRLVGFF